MTLDSLNGSRGMAKGSDTKSSGHGSEPTAQLRELQSDYDRKRSEWQASERVLTRALLRVVEVLGPVDAELARELKVLRDNLVSNATVSQFSGLINRLSERTVTLLRRRLKITQPVTEPVEQLMDMLAQSPRLVGSINVLRRRLHAGEDAEAIVASIAELFIDAEPAEAQLSPADVAGLFLGFLEQITLPPEFEARRVSLRMAMTAHEIDDPAYELSELLREVQMYLGRDSRLLAAFLKRSSQYMSVIDSQLRVALDQSRMAASDTTELTRNISAGLEELDASFQGDTVEMQVQLKVEENLRTVRDAVSKFLSVQDQQRQDYETRIAELTTQISGFERESARLRESLAAEHARAHRDPLTDSPNRLAYEERGELEIMRARRARTPLCLAVLDLDRFKSVNDRYGHRVGDRMLRSIAGIAQQRVRGTDLFARYGGEEFVGLFPETALDAAQSLCEDLRARIETAAFQFRGEIVPMTVSIGLASLRPDDTLDTLFERADAALYRAKAVGRNCLVVDE